MQCLLTNDAVEEGGVGYVFMSNQGCKYDAQTTTAAAVAAGARVRQMVAATIVVTIVIGKMEKACC